MNDEWKDINGFEGKYKVNRDGLIINRHGKKVNPELSQRGYMMVQLYGRGRKHNIKVHRIVAEAFIANPHKFPQVDHINGDKHDNRVENLRWVDNKTNNNGFKSKQATRLPVAIIDNSGNQLLCFCSLREAESIICVSRHGISAACRGIQRSAGGYRWRFL